MDDAENQGIKKQGQEALVVAKAWVKAQGKYDREFSIVYVNSANFLQSPPKANLPFPAWLLQRHVTHQIEEPSSAHPSSQPRIQPDRHC